MNLILYLISLIVLMVVAGAIVSSYLDIKDEEKKKVIKIVVISVTIISIIIAIIAFVASVYFEYRDKSVNPYKTIINIYYNTYYFLCATL